MKEIKGFQGEYRWLSNFWPADVQWNDIWFKTVEHAYQAAKSKDSKIHLDVAELPRAGMAKRYGTKLKRENKIRSDWDEVKLEVMEDLLRQKFNDPELKQKLLDTGNAYIEETNNWQDFFWGVCEGEGENHLGKLIMKIRGEL